MFKLTVMSFGFKHGSCDEVNILYDVRGFKNPYYVDELRDKTGLCDDVYEYVFSDEAAEAFFLPSVTAARVALDRAIALGKDGFTLAYACTGGKHRSVSFARRAKDYFTELGYDVVFVNRDCDKL
ncbi:MAG: hypothetical protein IJB24_03755 [Clostridia bacterium]|nr:hypothetical protein [Clostridia bacterium]MBQ4601956.1 hypothetical protein [Clostridia bacterium]